MLINQEVIVYGTDRKGGGKFGEERKKEEE
jgi:hypothetical protein